MMATQNKLRSARGTIFDQSPIDGKAARLPSPWDVLLASRSYFVRMSQLRRSRRALLDLTEDQLRDVGITREEALREGRKSFYFD